LHNVLNALAAIASGLALRRSRSRRCDPVSRDSAAWSGRFQRLGVANGVEVVDDYAHHPTEIRATLAAARTAFPARRIVAAIPDRTSTRGPGLRAGSLAKRSRG
jgi:UDP-N-acetylmuramate--alanine ligase